MSTASDRPRFEDARKRAATDCSASSGHSWNQSIVQQFTREGNLRRRVRKASPSGDMHSTTWMLALTRSRNWEKMFSFVAGMRFFVHSGLQAVVMASRSSELYRFGTSPLFRMPLMSSSIVSLMI